jgi:hypothetical protein
MKAPEPCDTVDTWKTKDGRIIPIRHLKQRHLENIITYLEKVGCATKRLEVSFEPLFIYDAWDTLPNSVPIDWVDPTYAALVAERKRREDERNHRRELRQRRLVQRAARQARVARKAAYP